MQPLTKDAGMSLSSVTLASALQVRGEALSEEEIWSLLFLAAEQLLEDLRNAPAALRAPALHPADHV
ncbi:FRMPD2 isoform 2 [Pan troglodytes]|uniref:FERM and PDZ domain containing 2 n=2 Tax=Homininae TaxID=207598 RepID=A0A1B0GV40_HUMAN|nr:FERM and PDZ domain containing 2 [Homo sapiens]KAI4075907.1 FERM and PDZ domain containing 2 [Homo sapiens]PNI21893.1 FRMPD2 isoform 2 [Pan troglodytes]